MKGAASKVEPGVWIHKNLDIKVDLAQARGVNVLPDGKVAITAAAFERWQAARQAK